MPLTPTSARVGGVASLLSPVLLLVYAAARWVDGWDGSHGPGKAWDVGHWAFLSAMLGFGLVMLALRGLVTGQGRPRLATTMAAVGVFGLGLFVWVIIGDLLPAFRDRFELPDPLMAAGPLFFLTGMLGPLVLLAAQKPRVVPIHAPAVVLAGFVVLAVQLDLLALAAVLFLVGLLDVGRELLRLGRTRWGDAAADNQRI